MRKLFVLIVALVSIMSGGMALAASPTDAAKAEVCTGVASGQPGVDCTGNSGEKTITSVLSAVLQLLSWIAGIAAIIMIVLAGMKYITSGGDSSAIASAKTSLIYALVGVIIVALAQVLVHFVLKTAKA